jgi:exosortase E/protease (VPEID-CTERM system)
MADSSASISLVRSQSWRDLPLARWAGLLLLLGAEVVGMTIRFDAYQHFRAFGWLGVALGQTRLIGRVAIASVLATFLFGGARACLDLARRPGAWSHRSHFWACLTAHLVSFVAFVGVSVRVLDGELDPTVTGTSWLAAWFALGVTSILSWLAAAFPVELWRLLVKRAAGSIVIGLACGVLAGSAGQITDQLWRPLGRSTLATVHVVMRLFVSDLVYVPSQATIGTSRFYVEISPQCSGYEGIGLVWVFLAAYLWFFRQSLKFPHALLLLPLGTAVMWCANVARIVALVLIGSFGSPEVAVGGFHSQAGWLILNGVGLGIIAVTRHFGIFERDRASDSTVQHTNPALSYLLPALVLVGTAMVTAAMSSQFDRLYPVRIFTVGAALWICRDAYRTLRGTVSVSAVAIGVVAFVVWMALEPSATRGAGSAALVSWLRALPPGVAGLWLCARVIGSVVVVPVAEELAFRGYLTRRLISANFQDEPLGRFTWFSFVAPSFVFGVLHDRWLAGTLAGLLYACAMYRRGSLMDAIVAHATTNALIAAYVLATGGWSLWL